MSQSPHFSCPFTEAGEQMNKNKFYERKGVKQVATFLSTMHKAPRWMSNAQSWRQRKEGKPQSSLVFPSNSLFYD